MFTDVRFVDSALKKASQHLDSIGFLLDACFAAGNPRAIHPVWQKNRDRLQATRETIERLRQAGNNEARNSSLRSFLANLRLWGHRVVETDMDDVLGISSNTRTQIEQYREHFLMRIPLEDITEVASSALRRDRDM